MPKKRKKTNRKKLEPWVTMDGGCSIDIRFARRLEKEPETLRRLGYRTVDLLLEGGHHRWLSETLALELTILAGTIVVDHLSELLHEVRAEGKKGRKGRRD